MDVFALFANTDYAFVKVAQKGQGNAPEKEWQGRGIARLKERMDSIDGMEENATQSTLHIRPDEPFVLELNGRLVGNAVRIANYAGEEITYRITDASQAPDYDEADFPFYRLILKREDLAPWQSALSLT